MRITIVGTEEECEVAADRIARILDARSVGRPSLRDDGKYQVKIDATLRKDPDGGGKPGSGPGA